MKSQLFDLTTDIFGYDGSWNGESARVHFRQPNDKDMLVTGIQYLPTDYFMEYKQGVFSGLYESVRSGNVQIVTIEGSQYQVRSVARRYDGDTYQAHIEKL